MLNPRKVFAGAMLRAALCAVAVLALSACSKTADNNAASAAAADPAAAEKSKAVLTVNGTVVTQGQMDLLMRGQPPQRDAPAARQRLLDNLTLQIIASQEAEKKGLDKQADVQAQLAMSHTSALAQAYVKDYFANFKASDAELQAAYDKIKADASGTQYHARHILVKTEAEANAIIAKLKKDPNAFSDLAKAQSLDPVSKVKGGDLGWFDNKMMVPEFSNAVAQLSKGKFTETPVKTTFGYHVIVLDDTRPAADAVPPFEQLKPQLTQRVQQEDLKKALEDMKAKAKIEVAADATPAPVPPMPAVPGQPSVGQPMLVHPPVSVPAPAPASAPAPQPAAQDQQKKN